jgi:hypothetical protein
MREDLGAGEEAVTRSAGVDVEEEGSGREGSRREKDCRGGETDQTCQGEGSGTESKAMSRSHSSPQRRLLSSSRTITGVVVDVVGRAIRIPLHDSHSTSHQESQVASGTFSASFPAIYASHIRRISHSTLQRCPRQYARAIVSR